MAELFAFLFILVGFAAAALSLPRLWTPEYLILAAVAAFALAGVSGIWRCASLLRKLVKQAQPPPIE